MADRVETVVVGGGQAGLAVSYCLSELGREHVILERARLAERWRSERWDSLAFQFPNWSLSLPGYAYRSADPDGFAPRDTVVRFIEEYATNIRPPLRLGVTVAALSHDSSDTYSFEPLKTGAVSRLLVRAALRLRDRAPDTNPRLSRRLPIASVEKQR